MCVAGTHLRARSIINRGQTFYSIAEIGFNVRVLKSDAASDLIFNMGGNTFCTFERCDVHTLDIFQTYLQSTPLHLSTTPT